MRRRTNPVSGMRGFGLVEIMVAMTLGLFILAGLYEVYIANKTTYRTQQALARLQENTRYAVQTLSHDLRMAGYAGCRRLGSLMIYPPATFTADNVVRGTNGADGASDTVTIKGASANAVPLSTGMASASGDIQIASNPDNLQKGDQVIISDCGSADIFTNIGDAATIKHGDALSKAYQPSNQAHVSAFRTIKYGIVNSALEKTINGGGAQELVQGVKSMQIQYGVNTSGNLLHSASQYIDADAVSDWSHVVSVRVALLMESLDQVTDSPGKETFNLLDAAVTLTGGDLRHLHRVVTFTVAIRNRVH